MKKPFLHALGAALYIILIVSLMFNAEPILGDKEDTIFMPMAMLGLFVLSAALMGFLFLSEPLQLFLENKKNEAASFFLKTVGFFACFVAVLAVLVLVI